MATTSNDVLANTGDRAPLAVALLVALGLLVTIVGIPSGADGSNKQTPDSSSRGPTTRPGPFFLRGCCAPAQPCRRQPGGGFRSKAFCRLEGPPVRGSAGVGQAALQ